MVIHILILISSHFIQPVLAYLDPGSGSYILQFIVAGLLGLAFAVKTYWKKLLLMFNRSRDKADARNDEEQ